MNVREISRWRIRRQLSTKLVNQHGKQHTCLLQITSFTAIEFRWDCTAPGRHRRYRGTAYGLLPSIDNADINGFGNYGDDAMRMVDIDLLNKGASAERPCR